MRHLLRVSIMAAGLLAPGLPVSSMAQPGPRHDLVPPHYHHPYRHRHHVPYRRPPPRHDYGPR